MVFWVRPDPKPAAPSIETDKPIPAERWRFETSSLVNPRLAVDGRLDTSWHSDKGEEKGQFFQVDLRKDHWVSKVSLGFSFPYSEFPRQISLNGYQASRGWFRLVLDEDPWRDAHLVDQLVEDPRRATLDFKLHNPELLKKIRLFIFRSDTIDVLPKWRIPEIRIYESSSHQASFGNGGL